MTRGPMISVEEGAEITLELLQAMKQDMTNAGLTNIRPDQVGIWFDLTVAQDDQIRQLWDQTKGV